MLDSLRVLKEYEFIINATFWTFIGIAVGSVLAYELFGKGIDYLIAKYCIYKAD